MSAPLSSPQTFAAVRYQTYVYSDGKPWEKSSGIKILTTETWAQSKKMAYNSTEGVFSAQNPRPYNARVTPVLLTEAQWNELIAGAKKSVSKQSESKQCY